MATATRMSFKSISFRGTLLVRMAFKFRQRIKTSPSCVYVHHETTLIWSFHVVVLQSTAKKCTISYNARANHWFAQ